MPKVGVLALQGGYASHMAALLRAGAAPFEVRTQSDLAKAEAIVIPGGESTVIGSLLQRFNMLVMLRDRILEGLPAFGTCAGLILLATAIEGKSQPGLGVLDITVGRNAYGTQTDSFRALVETAIPGAETLEAVFIRAPKILRVGPGVTVLASYGGTPILVQKGCILGATFHPELVETTAVHSWFLNLIPKRRESDDS
jgi:5'-phosphate synthase pdxT subunit